MNRGGYIGIVGIGVLFFFVERYLFSGIQKSFLFSYYVTFFFYLVNSFFILFVFKKSPPVLLLSLLILPQLLMGIYALVYLPFRIPDVYPISTILVFLGSFTGLLCQKRKKVSILLVTIITVFALNLYYYNISVPALFARASVIRSPTNQNLYAKILNLRNSELRIIDTAIISRKTIFMEFWFKNCEPCRLKMQTLQKLYELFKHDTTKVFYTVNVGNIDDFNTFKTETQKDEFKVFQNYYDSAGIFSSYLELNGLPAEIIIRKNVIIRKMIGWEQDMSDIYLTKTINLLKQ